MVHRIALLAPVILSVAGFVTGAQAATISFSTCTHGTQSGATDEGMFTYTTSSGSLFCDDNGNPNQDMEGLDGVGGILSIVRNDLAGGLFTFDTADIQSERGLAVNGPIDVTFEGLLNGIVQASDTFTTDSNWTSHVARNLDGILIDELQITLPAPTGAAGEVDNIVLTPTESSAVPEPSSVLVIATAFGALLLFRRRH